MGGTIQEVESKKAYDLKIAIGGDGTILKIIGSIHKKDGYILGVNFGTLGFLSELTDENTLEFLEQIFLGNFSIDERILIKTFAYRREKGKRKEKIISEYGLNEASFGHSGIARLTSFHVKAGRRFLSTYRSDGIIFSVPTGSTAYSMSAGGAIIHPNLKVIQITPVSPHNLTHRPIILDAKNIIHLSFEGRSKDINMTVDGQKFYELKISDEVTIQRATRTAKFIRFHNSNFFKTLRNKLSWGKLK
jgi:NAD+ kinase